LHPPDLGKDKRDEIVNMLTVGLYSHAHQINRREAKQIGLNVKFADKELDALLWNLFADYSTEMELEKPFNAQQLLANQASPLRVSVKRAFLESTGKKLMRSSPKGPYLASSQELFSSPPRSAVASTTASASTGGSSIRFGRMESPSLKNPC
jgi:hypothetical protein